MLTVCTFLCAIALFGDAITSSIVGIPEIVRRYIVSPRSSVLTDVDDKSLPVDDAEEIEYKQTEDKSGGPNVKRRTWQDFSRGVARLFLEVTGELLKGRLHEALTAS